MFFKIKNIYKIIILILMFITPSLFAKEKVSLQLQWKYQFQFAGYIAAKEKGFYEDIGLDVEIKEWTHGIDMVQEIVDQKATFAIARPTSFIDKTTRNHIRFLAAIYQSSPLVLVSDKSLGIKTIRDFKGKKLMSTGDLNTDASLVSMMFSQGIDIQDLEMIPPSFDVGDLLNGKTDLIASYISNEPYVLKEKGGDPIVFDPKDYGFDFYNDILITNTQNTIQKPIMVQKFTEATLKGWQYAFDNIDEVSRIIYQKYNTQNKSLDAFIYEGKELKKLAINGVDKLGSITAEKMQRIYDVYRLIGLTTVKDLDFGHLIYKYKKYDIGLTKEELEYVENNTVKVGISPWYPLTFYDSQKEKVEGVGVDILELLAKRLNLKIEYVPDSWNTLLDEFKKGNLDLLPTTFYTKNRETFGKFTSPYMDIKEYLYVKNDSGITGFDDLQGKKIAFVAKYGAIDKIKEKYPDIQIIEAETLEDTVKMVLNDEVAAIFNTQLGIESFLKENHIYSLKPIYQTSFKSAPLHYFTQKSNLHLGTVLEKGIQTITDTELKHIMSNWLQKGTSSLLSLEELQYVFENPNVKVCTNPNWTPIEFTTKDKQPNGISIDTLKLISEKTNLNFEFVKTKSWKESQEFLHEKKCDILPSAIETSVRKKYANFTKPYLTYDLAIITTNDKPLVAGLDSVIDKSMTRKAGSGLITVLKEKYPHINIIETKGYKEALEAVHNGEAYFTIATLPILSYYKNKYGLDDLQIAGYTKMKYRLSIAVRDDKQLLVGILDKALSDISEEEKNLIHEKWIDKEIKEYLDYGLLVQILIVLSVILLFFVYKQFLLKKSVKEFKEFINATMEGIVIHQNGYIVDLNESVLEDLGYSTKEELIGEHILKFVTEDYKELAQLKMDLKDTQAYEMELDKKDGGKIPVLVRGREIKDGKYRLVSIVNISSLKQKEEQILQQAKLASMGEMIGNIAHQWRQPLSVISTSATGIKVQKEYGILDDKFLFEACDAIDNNTQYLSKTIDDFTDFIKGDRKKNKFSAKLLVDSFKNLIEASSKMYNIQILVDIDKDIMIDGYQNELNQCFMNIYNNSKDVFVEESDKEKQKLFFIKIHKDNESVYITFTDNGGGIPKNVLPNIFDPYFTTKHKSQGTGLGLNMTYNLINEGMEGKIEAKNSDYEYKEIQYTGAQFIITLPL